MKEHLLKRALPFALTFAVGAAVGGFFQMLGARGAGWFGRRHAYSYAGRHGCGKRFRRRAHTPESRPPVILFKPDARLPDAARGEGGASEYWSARVRVTFGEDGKVRDAKSVFTSGRWLPQLDEAAERAARQIRFIPATVEDVPTTVTEEIEVRFSSY